MASKKRNPITAGLMVALIGPFAFGYIRSPLVVACSFLSGCFYLIGFLSSISAFNSISLNHAGIDLINRMAEIMYIASIILAVYHVQRENARADQYKPSFENF